MNYYDNSDPASSSEYQPAQPLLWRIARQNIPIFVFLGLAMMGMLVVYWYFEPTFGVPETAVAATLPENSLSAPLYKDTPGQVVAQRLKQSPGPVRIGIISGHKDNDSGAVCENDGLTEASINLNVATQVMNTLQQHGVAVEILSEFDPRLPNYQATALISLHADSCGYYNEFATGFKIASSSRTDSQELFDCMEQSYREATELPYHANTITQHMTDYHAFRKIGVGTPAIILELGFMNLDREILTIDAHRPAAGVSNGILCFLGQ